MHRELEWPAPRIAIEGARAFVREHAPGRTVAVAFDNDVDGLTSGILAARAVERLGGRAPRLLARRSEHVHADSMRERILATAPAALIVTDQGSRAEPIVPGIPTMILDHHAHRGGPPGALLVSAYGHEPVASSSLLAWHVLRDVTPLDDLEWLALLGAVADLGSDLPFPELQALLKAHGRGNVTEAVALLNAARRAPVWDGETALAVLEAARDAADVARDRVPGVDRLRADRAAVNAEVQRCARVPPKIAGQVALIRFASPAQIHPLVAVRWKTRLKDKIVVAANDGYLPGRVNFAMRTKLDIDLVAWLRGLGLGEVEGEFARGHAAATGGSVPPAEFARILAAMGF